MVYWDCMATHFWNLVLLIGLLLGASPRALASPDPAAKPFPCTLEAASPAPAREWPAPEFGACRSYRSSLVAMRHAWQRFFPSGDLASYPVAVPVPVSETCRLRLSRSRATLPPLRSLPTSPRDPPD